MTRDDERFVRPTSSPRMRDISHAIMLEPSKFGMRLARRRRRRNNAFGPKERVEEGNEGG